MRHPSSYLLQHFKGTVSNLSSSSPQAVVKELEMQIKTNKVPRTTKLLPLLRELTIIVEAQQEGEGRLMNVDTAILLSSLLKQLKDGDNDARKVARNVHFYVTEIITTLYSSTGGNVGEADQKKINSLYTTILEDAAGSNSHYIPRRFVAFQSIGALSVFTSMDSGDAGIVSSPHASSLQQQTFKSTIDLIKTVQTELQNVDAAMRLKGQKKKEHQEIIMLSSSVSAMIRRVVVASKGMFCPPAWLSFLYDASFSTGGENTSRSALAAIVELLRYRQDLRTEIAIHLYTNKKLHISVEEMADTLQSIYYLQLCAHMVFPSATEGGLSPAIREEYCRVLLRSIHDKRIRVSLEAITLLFSQGHHAAPSSFVRFLDLPGVVRVLCKALQDNAASALTLHGILRATRSFARWVVQEQEERTRASTSLETNAVVPPGVMNQLYDAVMTILALIASSPSLGFSAPHSRSITLASLVWLTPSPPLPAFPSSLSVTAATPASSGNKALAQNEVAWKSLEKQITVSFTYLTDQHFEQLLDDCMARAALHSSSSPRAQKLLIQILLKSVHTVVCNIPSDKIFQLALRVWRFIFSLSGKASAPEQRLYQLSQQNAQDVTKNAVLSSILTIMDEIPRGATSNKKEGGRQRLAWELQGRKGPPSIDERRALHVRFLRSCAWFLGEYVTNFPQNQMGVILLRLKTLSLYSDSLTRHAAISALSKIAVVVESLDVKMVIYEFFTSLDEQGSFDRIYHLSGADAAEVNSVQCCHRLQLEASDFFDTVEGGENSQADVIEPTIAYLDSVFQALTTSVTSLPLGVASMSIQDTAGKTGMDTSLFVVKE